MKKLLLILMALLVGVTSLSAKEAKEEREEKKELTSAERHDLIIQAIKTGEVELVIDPWGGKGIESREYQKTDHGWVTKTSQKTFFIERGYTFKPLSFIDGFRYVFEKDEKFFVASMSEVYFEDSDDAEELEFMIRGESRLMDSLAGRFYGTSAALNIMLLVMGVAAMVAFLYLKGGMASMRPLFLAVVPAAILVFSLIEIYGYAKFGSHIFWWCEYDRYGFFGSLFRVFPFGLMVAAQVFSIKLYERALFKGNDDPSDDERKISLKPAAWSLALCIPVFIVLILIVAGLGLEHTILMDIAGIGGFLGTLGVGLYISFKRNIKSFGKTTGLYVTLFSIVYIIGCIISAIAMITLIFRIILQILLVIGAILIFAMMGYRRRVYRNGRVYEEVY